MAMSNGFIYQAIEQLVLVRAEAEQWKNIKGLPLLQWQSCQASLRRWVVLADTVIWCYMGCC